MAQLFPQYHIGHFLGEPQRPCDFALTRFQEMEELDIEDPHTHSFYEILWFDEGLSTQVIDYQEYDIQAGSLFFISPNQLHHFVEWQPLRGGSIFFTADFFLLANPNRHKLFELTFLDNFFGQPGLQLDTETFQEIRQTIALIEREYVRTDQAVSIIQSLLQVLLAQIQRCIDRTDNTTPSKRYLIHLKEFKALLDQHYREGLSAQDYAQQLHLTQHHLNLICKETTGYTTTQLIRARTVLEAKRMLTFTDLTVSQIAADLGYFDLSYFAKVFRAEAACNPLSFRKSMSEKCRNL